MKAVGAVFLLVLAPVIGAMSVSLTAEAGAPFTQTHFPYGRSKPAGA